MGLYSYVARPLISIVMLSLIETCFGPPCINFGLVTKFGMFSYISNSFIKMAFIFNHFWLD